MTGLEELLTYGLKGMASYAYHAQLLGFEDEGVYAFFHEALDYLTREDAHTAEDLLGWALRCGEVNLRVMELLDAAHTANFGDPEPTQVRIEPVKGKAILVSGHDLMDLKELLEQTKGKGVKVYTHGEMLPAHAYPGLKKYKHLVGNYGGAWQQQREEFEAFPGAILMTTNCIQKPKESYQGRIEGSIAILHVYPGTPLERTAREAGVLPAGFSWTKRDFSRIITLPMAQGEVPLFVDRLTWRQISELVFRWSFSAGKKPSVLRRLPQILGHIRSFGDVRRYAVMGWVYFRLKLGRLYRKIRAN